MLQSDNLGLTLAASGKTTFCAHTNLDHTDVGRIGNTCHTSRAGGANRLGNVCSCAGPPSSESTILQARSDSAGLSQSRAKHFHKHVVHDVCFYLTNRQTPIAFRINWHVSEFPHSRIQWVSQDPAWKPCTKSQKSVLAEQKKRNSVNR